MYDPTFWAIPDPVTNTKLEVKKKHLKYVLVSLMIPVWLHQNLHSFSLNLINEIGLNVANERTEPPSMYETA